eukprot:1043152-Ditylum_brightwellii.AAC.1
MVINIPGSTHDSMAAMFGFIYAKVDHLYEKFKCIFFGQSSSPLVSVMRWDDEDGDERDDVGDLAPDTTIIMKSLWCLSL